MLHVGKQRICSGSEVTSLWFLYLKMLYFNAYLKVCYLLSLILAYHTQIVIQKIDRGVLLFPLFLPLLQNLATSYSSLLIQGIAEGQTYCNRLQALVEQKVRLY